MGWLALTTAREVADLSASHYVRYELAADLGLPSTLLQAGKVYDEESKDMKRRADASEVVDHKGRGAPHLHAFMSGMLYGASRTPAEGPGQAAETQLKDEMRELWSTQLATMPLVELGRLVLYFRIKTHRKTEQQAQRCTIIMRFAVDIPLGKMIADLMEQLVRQEGGTFLSGSAPRRPLSAGFRGC